MVELFTAIVDIFINAYNSANDWFKFLFTVDENSPLYRLGEISQFILDFILPDFLENGVVGDVLSTVVNIGTQPLIVAIFGSTLLVCIVWSIIKWIIPL